MDPRGLGGAWAGISNRGTTRQRADDLTYAVHDVDDFFRAGLIPLHRLGGQDRAESTNLLGLLTDARDAEPRSFSDYEPDELVEAVKHPLSIHGPGVAYEHTKASRATMREFGSNLIIADIG